MKRLASTVACDARLQYRNGFYYAAAAVALFWMAALSQVPKGNRFFLLPPFVLTNLMMNTFYFVAGLVLLEKREGTLAAQVVTPLRSREYLASKVATLTALSLIENLVIVLFSSGLGFNVLPLIVGMTLAAGFYTLVGFVLVARYDSINEYLFPSFVYTMAFAPPFLHYFGLFETRLVLLHPLQASLLLMKAGFHPIALWEWSYGLLYALFWCALAFRWSESAFHRFVVATEGAR